MPWVVTLVKRPKIFCWQSNYFPRKFAYKKQAEQCAAEVKKCEGEAKVEKTK